MRNSLTLALLALVLVSLGTATWAGVTALVVDAPVALARLVSTQSAAFAPLVAISLTRLTASAPARSSVVRAQPACGPDRQPGERLPKKRRLATIFTYLTLELGAMLGVSRLKRCHPISRSAGAMATDFRSWRSAV